MELIIQEVMKKITNSFDEELEKETKSRIWISYKNRYGERVTKSFRNAYGKLNEEIR